MPTNARKLKSRLLLAGVLGAIAALLAWSQTWFSARFADSANGVGTVDAAGMESAPVFIALSLAALACIAVLAIAGRLARTIGSILLVLFGAGMSVSALFALLDPLRAVSSGVSKATGIDGLEAISAVVKSVSASAWPFIGIASGAVVVIVGIAILTVHRYWPGSAGRFESGAKAVSRSEGEDWAGSWDQLADGNDPTENVS
ncbi:MAG: Trp biosynthesis-associated membrane protein [Cryobacterium sp.]|nr:Trp biosynthesis-associated membrane protein [Cryobacterium sp.]MBX3090549.1 Trp biosynthesis-associated membrane protein [Cryobacterium sp.]MBX3115835.1 Trp biosynthesis-associated membrane protein [Cryobacterium sp.]MCO5293940.1 Trp biosynthesis-associated membrane protein [Homoserinimonas sp.]